MDHLKLAGRYEIQRELGRGGMGVVYLARDPVLDRLVAIKTLRSQKLDAETQERFDREARAIAKMDHPGIVQIFDIGSTDEGSFFVMSYVEGKNLRDHLESGGLEVHEILELASQVAEALAYSHSKGIVHRDIKPENIMVFGEKEHRRAKLMDFGISLANQDSRLTDANSIFGTLVYLPPESILSQPIGPGADIYSLGAVLYESLTGRLPFDGDPNSILMKIVNAEPKSLRSLNPKVDPLTEALVLNCLAKTPLARPRSAGQLAAALHDHARELREGTTPGEVDLPQRREMVGRKEPFVDLTQAFRRALAGVAQLTLVEGETGLGKSTLLSELAHFARGRGATVLSGRFVERSDPSSPFQAFGDALGDFLNGACVDPEVHPAEILGDLMPGLIRLFPQLAPPRLSAERITSPEELRPTGSEAIDLIAHAIGRIADATPLVLLLDSLDQADVSIQALHYIYRRRPTAKLHLVGTYALSDMDSDHPLHKLLKALAGERRVTRIGLGPLTEVETGELMGLLTTAELSAGTIHAVHDLTGGNPLFIVDLVNSLIETDRLKDVPVLGSEIDMPESLRRLCEDRIASLSAPDRSVLANAAILGTVFDADTLCELDGSAGAEDRIDSLIARRIFREQGKGTQGRLAFCSTLFRDVTYRSIPALKRRALHRRAAERLQVKTAKRPQRAAAQLYEHLIAANDPTAAAPFAVVAARTALATGSHEDALRFARCAVEATRDESYTGDAGVAGEALLLWASSSEALGDVTNALERSKNAAEEFATAEIGSRRLEAIRVGADIAINHLRLDEARATAILGQREARAAGEEGLEQAFTQSLSRIDALRGGEVEIDTGAVHISARSARDLVSAGYLAAEEEHAKFVASRDGAGIAQSLLALASFARRLGRHETSLRLAVAAQAVVPQSQPLEFAQILSVQAEALLALGKLQEAIEVCETGLGLSSGLPEQSGLIEPLLQVQKCLVETLTAALIASGRAKDVKGLLTRGPLTKFLNGAGEPWGLMIELEAELALSNVGAAEEILTRLSAFPDQSVLWAARVCCLSARLWIQAGAADRAQREAERGLAVVEDYYDTDLHTSLRLALGQALVGQEQASAAEEAFLIANRSANVSGTRLLAIDAQIGLSTTHVARGRFLAAEVAARIAVRLAAEAGAGPREAAAQSVLATALAGSEQHEAALSAVQSARDVSSRLGLTSLAIDCDIQAAALSRRLGRAEAARTFALEASKVAADRGDMLRLSRATVELGSLDRVLGQFNSAQQELERALTTSLMAGSEGQSARIRLDFGGCLLDMGDSAAARRQASAVSESGGAEGVPASLGLDARLLEVQCDVADGLASTGLKVIEEKLVVATDPLSRARMLISAAEAVAGASREQALVWLDQAMTTADEAEAHGLVAMAHGGISQIRLREGDLNEALLHARQENEWLSRSGNAGGVIRNRIRVSHCYMQAGDFEQALAWIGDKPPAQVEPSLAFDWFHARCVLEIIRGRFAEAVENLKALEALADSVWPFGRLRAQITRARLGLLLGPSNSTVATLRATLASVRRPSHGFVRIAACQTDLIDARIKLFKGDVSAGLAMASGARDTLHSAGRTVQAAEADLVALEGLASADPQSALAGCARITEYARTHSLNLLLSEALLLSARIQGTSESVREGLEAAEMIASPWTLARLATLGLGVAGLERECVPLLSQAMLALNARMAPATQSEIAKAVRAGAQRFGPA